MLFTAVCGLWDTTAYKGERSSRQWNKPPDAVLWQIYALYPQSHSMCLGGESRDRFFIKAAVCYLHAMVG